ncbi:hypothetical protein ACIGXM_28185 [Kitasatospora sp. NPDC052896]
MTALLQGKSGQTRCTWPALPGDHRRRIVAIYGTTGQHSKIIAQ